MITDEINKTVVIEGDMPDGNGAPMGDGETPMENENMNENMDSKETPMENGEGSGDMGSDN